MYPEDRVLVGVINRERDLLKARDEHWYRVPYGQAPKGIYAEVIAFYLSRAFKELNGGIHFYARRTGLELVQRRDLLPGEASHPRAAALYHKLQLGDLRRKDPPILNPRHRPVAFIYTTWDRFAQAAVLADLYSQADDFVDRVFHALEQSGVRPQRTWEAARSSAQGGAQLRIDCEEGIVIASTAPAGQEIPLPVEDGPRALRASVAAILHAIEARGGARSSDPPREG